jgi:hypothetical protein
MCKTTQLTGMSMLIIIIIIENTWSALQEGGQVARLGPPFSKIPAARVLSGASKPEVAAASAGKV